MTAREFLKYIQKHDALDADISIRNSDGDDPDELITLQIQHIAIYGDEIIIN